MTNKSKSPKYQYAEKLKDPRWQKLRLQVFERDGWKCRVCDSKTDTLHAHHTYYETDSEGPWDYRPETIITLCAQCHEDEHEFVPDMKASLLRSLSVSGLFLTGSDILFLEVLLYQIKDCIDSKGENKEWEKSISDFIEYHINNNRKVIGGDL